MTSVLQRLTDGYSTKEPRPLGGYLTLMGGYVGLVGAVAAVGRARGARLPSRLPLRDVALVAAASAKGARLLARDKVTSPLRAPFTRFVDFASGSEVEEEPRGEGLRLAVGELVTCPWCLGQWVATALVGGLVVAPRATRLAAATLAALGAADLLQTGYTVVQAKAAETAQL